MIAAVVLGIGSLALVSGCGSSSNGESDGSGTTTTTAPTTMTTPIPGSTYPPSTQVTGSTPGTGSAGSTLPGQTVPPTTVPLVPGQPCTPGSSPDCISPEGDGQYVYLIGGAKCMASPIGGPLCSDLDGDGNAGYPDAG